MENENENTVSSPAPVVVTSANRPMGALIGTIIVLVILILGGFYIWSTRIQPAVEQKFAPTDINQTAKATAETNVAVEQLATQNPSDDTASIESDLNATNLSNIDKDLQTI